MSKLVNILITAILTGLGAAIYAAGLGPALILWRRKSPRVLMYHACEPVETGFTRGLSINAPPARFDAQLDFLTRHYRIVSLEDIRDVRGLDRAVAITFDDGYRSVHQHAFSRLKSRNLPATVFLVSGAIDNLGIVWLNALAWYLDRDPVAAREIIADRLGLSRMGRRSDFLAALIDRYDPAAMEDLVRELESKLGASALQTAREDRFYLGKEEIAEMSRHGITYGNHTASHANLGRLPMEAQREEIERAKRTLDGLDGSIDALAYPFGIFDEATIEQATELGYSMLLEVKGDNHPLDLRHIARLNVTSDSPAVLFARMEVVYPVKAALNRLVKAILRRGRDSR